jgi:hypothetical protein
MCPSSACRAPFGCGLIRALRRVGAALFAALFALVLAVSASLSAAQADTLIQPLTGARDVAQGGGFSEVMSNGQITQNSGWLAWAQPAGLGRWQLIVRSPQGVITTPAIRVFGAAPDPSIGSDRFGASGRRLYVVYSRCSGTSAIAGCDVYRYDLVAGTETKVTAISTATASETAPSVRSGQWSFVRRGAGASRPGVYVYTPRGGARRLSSVLARETVLSASRVAYAYNSSRGGGVAVRRLSGEGGVVLATTGESAVPSSLVGTRYKFGWLLGAGDAGMSVNWTSRLSGGTTSVTVRSGKRKLSASTNSITTNDHVPDKYLDDTGIFTLSPPLF